MTATLTEIRDAIEDSIAILKADNDLADTIKHRNELAAKMHAKVAEILAEADPKQVERFVLKTQLLGKRVIR